MNCKQAQEMLPLYAGRDLDENRARLLTQHLQSCADCARCAEEYESAFHLTQQFATPVFSDHVYAGIRRRVLQQIDEEPTARTLPALIGGWWRPRLAWALASAFVLALALFAFYFVASRRLQHEEVAIKRGTISQPGQGNQSPAPPVKQTAATPYSSPNQTQPKRVTIRRPMRPSSPAKVNDSQLQIAKLSLRVSDAADTLPNSDATAAARALRVEMQTKDPNIRIIWFSGGH